MTNFYATQPHQMPDASTVCQSLIRALRTIVGRKHVLTGDRATRRYRMGFRSGGGDALAVVRPGTLLEQWRVLQQCVSSNAIVIVQASNTGLTGGSTPAARGYDRAVVIISTRRLKSIFLVEEGRQVICLPGSTLHELEQRLRPLGREPHSVIGSSCIGASVIGGVCNNSGGSLIRRGPAYTQMALFARVDAHGRLQLVNHLGVNLGDAPEEMLARLQDGQFRSNDIEHPDRAGCDHDYARRVRDIDAGTPARFNADPRCLYEASGSAGKVMIFAVRLDTFAMESTSTVFYIGTNDPADLGRLRRLILGGCASLPVAGEYLHRDAFDLAEQYGKDQFLLIEHLGTDRLPYFFDLKNRCDDLCRRVKWLPPNMIDRVLQTLSRLFPRHLPARLKDYRHRFEHHLMLRVACEAVGEMRAVLCAWSKAASSNYFECSDLEARKAFLHRFVVAGAAVRYRAVHPKEVEDIVALDVALRRNDTDWFETLPPDIDGSLIKKVYYGHFLCHVLHQDYIVAKGHDCAALERRMWRLLDERGARYPAEHNVGHMYHANPTLQAFYRSLDPGNRFNAGIGHMSNSKDYAAISNAARSHDIYLKSSEGLSA